MPTLKLYPNGVTAGVAPGSGQGARAKRDTCGGWSVHSIRNNTRFLYSVDHSGLSGFGLALTLTVRDCPPRHETWQAMRRAYVHRLRRRGLIRLHWLTEWQRRRVPHLHGALWLPEPSSWPSLHDELVGAWLAIARAYGAERGGQTIAPIWDATGWFRYQSKHAARGLWHYQRTPEAVPPGWQGATGRMWGHCGDWPTRDALEVDVNMAGYHVYRRLVRAWRKADARREGSARRISQARRMLACNDPKVSAVRGVSQWLALEDQLRLVSVVGALGHEIRS